MHGRRRNFVNSIFFRMSMVFVIIMIPMYTTGILIYRQWTRNIADDVAQSTVAQMSAYLEDFEREIDRMKRLQYDCLNDEYLNKLAIRWKVMDTYPLVESMRLLQQRLITIQYSSRYIRDVSAHIKSFGRTITALTGVNALNAENFASIRAAQNQAGAQIVCHQGGYYLSTLQSGRISGKNPLYMIEIRLNPDALREALADLNTYEGSCTLLYFSDGGVIADSPGTLALFAEAGVPDGASTSAGFQEVWSDGRAYYRATAHSDYLNAMMVRYIPAAVIRNIATAPSFWVWFLTGAALMVALIYSLATYKYMHKPLYRLVDAFREVERGNLNVSIDQASDSEFGYLFDGFNGMVQKLSASIDQIYKQKLLTQRAELKQLQTQISPHFLYNSMFAINTMARLGDENLIPFTRLLGEYLQFITRNASDDVPLHTEVRYARTYGEIQQMRYPKRIAFDFPECPEAYRDVPVPRLILQPLLENAFEHGLGRRFRDGLVRVRFCADGPLLHIDVEDNGAELTDERIAQIGKTLNDPGEFAEVTALINIHRRLQLVYGRDGALELSRSGLGGLKVRITISTVRRDAACTDS